uniref:Uncharacterized protein n=1 Tax=Trichuris muris TaxID=70415 RepID=A0A5S6Q9B5_TRIMR
MIYQLSSGSTFCGHSVNVCSLIAGKQRARCPERTVPLDELFDIKPPLYSGIPDSLTLRQSQFLYRKMFLSKGLLERYQEWSWSVASFTQLYMHEDAVRFTFNDSSDFSGVVKYTCNNVLNTNRKMLEVVHNIYIMAGEKTESLNYDFLASFNKKDSCSSFWQLGNSDLHLSMDHYVEQSVWMKHTQGPQECVLTNHTLEIQFKRNQDKYAVTVRHSCADRRENSFNGSKARAKCWHTQRMINCKVSALLLCEYNTSTLVTEFVALMKVQADSTHVNDMVRSLVNEWTCEMTFLQTLCADNPGRIEISYTNGRCRVVTQPEVTPRYVGPWYSGVNMISVAFLLANTAASLLMWISFHGYRTERSRTAQHDKLYVERKRNFEIFTNTLEQMFQKNDAGIFIAKLNSDHRGLSMLRKTLSTVWNTERNFFLVNKNLMHNDLFVGLLHEGTSPADLWCFILCNNIGCTVFFPECSDSYYRMANCLPLRLKRKRSIVRCSSLITAIREDECNGNQYVVCEIRRLGSAPDRCFIFLLTNWSVEFFDKMSHRQYFMPQVIDETTRALKGNKWHNVLLAGKRQNEMANFIALLHGQQMCVTSGEMSAHKCALYAKNFIADAFSGPTAENQTLALHYGLHVLFSAVRTLDCILSEEKVLPNGIADSLLIRTAQAGLRYDYSKKGMPRSTAHATKKASDGSQTHAENRSH